MASGRTWEWTRSDDHAYPPARPTQTPRRDRLQEGASGAVRTGTLMVTSPLARAFAGLMAVTVDSPCPVVFNDFSGVWLRSNWQPLLRAGVKDWEAEVGPTRMIDPAGGTRWSLAQRRGA